MEVKEKWRGSAGSRVERKRGESRLGEGRGRWKEEGQWRGKVRERKA